MNVYEEEKYPFLRVEDRFLKQVIQEEVPFLGVCLGSQLLAKSCGARVCKSPLKEVGWFQVGLEPTAEEDPLFEGLGPSLDVFQWHEDTFDIPAGGVLLAKGRDCPHQAFRIGRFAYGIQFHIEVTEGIIAQWCQSYFKSEDFSLRQKAQEMVEGYKRKKEDFDKQSDVIYQNFTRLISHKRVAKG